MESLRFYLVRVIRPYEIKATVPVIGHWATERGFSQSIREAQIFTSMDQIKARMPSMWAFEVIEFTSGSSLPLYKTYYTDTPKHELIPYESHVMDWAPHYMNEARKLGYI